VTMSFFVPSLPAHRPAWTPIWLSGSVRSSSRSFSPPSLAAAARWAVFQGPGTGEARRSVEERLTTGRSLLDFSLASAARVRALRRGGRQRWCSGPGEQSPGCARTDGPAQRLWHRIFATLAWPATRDRNCGRAGYEERDVHAEGTQRTQLTARGRWHVWGRSGLCVTRGGVAAC